MSFCSEITPTDWPPKFTGCDGKKWSNKFLQFHIDKAIICLTFEDAKLIMDYLNLNPDIGTKSEA